MIYTEPLFLGVTPSGARNYVADKVVSLEKPLFNACAGRFSVVEAAIKAGVPRQNVFASDIGLFSSIIGYLADRSKKLDDLGIRILDPALEPKGITDELDFAAHVMLILKLNQMKQTNLRGLYLREELLASWNRSRAGHAAAIGNARPKHRRDSLRDRRHLGCRFPRLPRGRDLLCERPALRAGLYQNVCVSKPEMERTSHPGI